MDIERESDFSASEVLQHESGYSEEEQAKDIERKGYDYKNVKKRKPVLSSQKDRIIAAYRKNAEAILILTESIYEFEENRRQEEHLVAEVKRLQRLQEELITALILEQKGAFSKESISKEAWNLIE